MGPFFQAVFPPGLIGDAFMQNAWLAGTATALTAAAVGTFVVLRSAPFAAHAIPRASFAGAAGALLLGASSLLGVAVFATLSAVGIGLLGERSERGPVTALVLAAALGTGALFLAVGDVYEPAAYALLFGQILGVSTGEVVDAFVLFASAAVGVAMMYRPLLLASVSPAVAEAKGTSVRLMNLLFLLLVALASALTVPVVGALLAFSLLVGPPAAASRISRSVPTVMALSAAFALASVWLALIFAYDTGWPSGFFVSGVSAVIYLGARWVGHRRRGAFQEARLEGGRL